MKRIHFDSKGPVRFHYFFWQPWGCMGCLGRALLFLVLLFFFFLLLSLFRSCDERPGGLGANEGIDTTAVSPVVPPIDERDVIDDNGRRIVSNRLNILFEAQVGEEGMKEWIEKFKTLYPSDDYQVLFYDVNTKLMSIQVPADRRAEMITELPERIPDIPFMVFEEGVMDIGYTPSDPAFSATGNPAWHAGAVDAFSAWNITKGAENVVVAVVDSYFDLDNPEFRRSNIVHPYSVANGDDNVELPSEYSPSNPDPVLCHGTMVAALTLGGMDNGHGAAGIAPECSFMPISLGARFGCLAMLQGLLYAINHGAKVVNISAGMTFADEMSQLPVDQQIAIARNELLAQEDVWKYVFAMADKFKVTIVWAAGNENVFTALDASKRGDTTIKVSAVDRNFRKADFSNFGNFEDRGIYESTVSAPGVEIYGEVPGTDNAMAIKGTSFSAPIVAGATGLVKSLDPTLSTIGIADIFKSTGRQTNPEIGPVIQIGQALLKVIDGFMPFDTFKSMCTSTGAVSSTVPTTIQGTLVPGENDDTTALMPLINVEFAFSSPTSGTVRYISNLAPETPWEAPFRVTYSAETEKFTIRQSENAVREGVVPMDKAVFTVARGAFGKAYIEKIESSSIPSSFKAYIKLPSNGQ